MIFDKKQSIDVREIRRMLWRRRLVIALPLLIAVGAGVAEVVPEEVAHAPRGCVAGRPLAA